MFFILPYGNDRHTRRFPAITYTLMLVNAAAFLWMLARHVSASRIGLLPDHPSVLDMITSMFVHANVYHLGWNMLFLWLFGPNVEDALGRPGYAMFYLASGVAAALLHIFVVRELIPAAATVSYIGASGAIAGILGIFAIRFYKTNIKVFWCFGILIYPLRWGTFAVPAVMGLGIWFLEQLYGGLQSIGDPASGGVAYWSHIGGMMCGMILASAAKMGAEGSKEYLMDDAKTFIERGTAWEAIESLESLVDRDPDNADAHSRLGRLYADRRIPREAIAHFKRSIEIHLNKGEREKASLGYSELKDFDRDATLDLRSEFQIARYLMEACLHKPAVQMFQSIWCSYPGTPEAEVSLMKAGDICMDALNDPPRAVRCYERFLREYPQSAYRTMIEKSLEEAGRRIG